MLAPAKATLAAKWGKAMYHWSLYRPSAVPVAGHMLAVEDGLNILGLSAATGGDPEEKARVTARWRAFHAKTVHITRRLIRWSRVELPAGPVLTYGSWGWPWSSRAGRHCARNGPLAPTPRGRILAGLEQTLSASHALVVLEEGSHLLLQKHHQPLCQAVERVAASS